MHHPRLQGLYGITDARDTRPEQLIHKVSQALRGGTRIIQYRDKGTDHARRYDTAQQLRLLTRQHNAMLIINDDIELARQVTADGVHLGQDDTHYDIARRILGNEAIIGVSCYNRFDLAQQAEQRGADYVAFGRFFPSRTKPDAVQADINLLQRANRELSIPIAAIGGITAENGLPLIKAGARMLAVVNALFDTNDSEAAARDLQSLFNVFSDNVFNDNVFNDNAFNDNVVNNDIVNDNTSKTVLQKM